MATLDIKIKKVRRRRMGLELCSCITMNKKGIYGYNLSSPDMIWIIYVGELLPLQVIVLLKNKEYKYFLFKKRRTCTV